MSNTDILWAWCSPRKNELCLPMRGVLLKRGVAPPRRLTAYTPNGNLQWIWQNPVPEDPQAYLLAAGSGHGPLCTRPYVRLPGARMRERDFLCAFVREIPLYEIRGGKTVTMKVRTTCLFLSAAIANAQLLPNLFPLPNGSGLLETYNVNNQSISLSGAFFQSLGTNGEVLLLLPLAY